MEMETSSGNRLRIRTCNAGMKVSEMQLPVPPGCPDGEAPGPARLLLRANRRRNQPYKCNSEDEQISYPMASLCFPSDCVHLLLLTYPGEISSMLPPSGTPLSFFKVRYRRKEEHIRRSSPHPRLLAEDAEK
jgi:hypothetical protein